MDPDTATSDARLAAVTTALGPGAGWLSHRHHHEDELVVVLSGGLDVVVSSHRRHLKQGRSMVLPRGVSHAAVAGSQGATVLTVLAPAGFEHGHRRLCEPTEARDFEAVVALAARHGCEVTGPAPTAE